MSDVLYRATGLIDFAESRFSAVHRTVVDIVNRLAVTCTRHSLLHDADEAERIERRLRLEADHFQSVAVELRRRSDAL